MALLDLYMQTTGSNLNAGTDQVDAPTEISSVTCVVASGTITFTGASNSFAGIAAGANGAWVSLYNSADTASRFVGRVDSNDNTTITVLYNSGTGYSTTGLGLATGLTSGGSAAAVRCRVGGAWAGFGITSTGGAMTGTVPSLSGAMTASTYAGIRVNVKAGTYSNSAAVTLPSGLLAKPIWWRGYYATIGDLDNYANVNGTMVSTTGATLSGATRPQITSSLTTGSAVNSGTYGWFENLEFSASGACPFNLQSTVGYVRMHRCRVALGTTGAGLQTNNSTFHAIGCFFGGTSVYSVNYGNYQGCTFRSGCSPIAANTVFNFCIFDTITTGMTIGSAGVSVTNCIFYKCTTGINLQAAATLPLIENNIFSECTTAITNNMTSPWQANIINNDYHNNTNSTTPVWESFQRGQVTESALPYSPFVAKANRDFTLASDANARQAGFPGQFEV